MADANALTYLQLQDAVLGRRFPAASQRDNAKRWLATAYQDVWNAADWTFKRVSLSTLTLTTGDSTPVMPSDFGDTIDLYDSQGTKLQRLAQEDFEWYGVQPTFTGTPYIYMVTNRQVTLAPIPEGGDLRHSYFRRLSHKEPEGTVTGGFMDEDTDYPLWDDHHSILIPRAQALGLLELNDPTWEQQQEEYERQLDRMRDDYEQVRPQVQWGRACWAG